MGSARDLGTVRTVARSISNSRRADGIVTNQCSPSRSSCFSRRVLSSLYNPARMRSGPLLAFAPVSIFCYRFMERGRSLTYKEDSRMPSALGCIESSRLII